MLDSWMYNGPLNNGHIGGRTLVRCRGSKCTICIGRAIGGMEFVGCTEVVHVSESPLLEVSLYNGPLVI